MSPITTTASLPSASNHASLARSGKAYSDLGSYTTERHIFLIASATTMFVVLGLAGSLAGFAKGLVVLPISLLAAAWALGGLICYASFVALRKVSLWPDARFVTALVLFCLLSRCLIIFAFPHYVLAGDEGYLHGFVVSVAEKGMGRANLSALSSLYDYPVWLSRAFPIYFPMRVLFGSADLIAVRFCNAILGGVSVALVYWITRSLVPQSYARLAAGILAISPYHLADTLSYDPQIPGTFFFLAGIWLALDLIYSRSATISAKSIFRAVLLGFVLWLAGVQRGGIDALLFVGLVISAALCYFAYKGRLPAKRCAALLAISLVVWLPMQSAFQTWIASTDTHHVRSHVLGFMTRGWNLVSMGEYLARYEQLDISAPVNEKARVLKAVLVTEDVRRPVDVLAVVPPVKIAKFLAIGYGAWATDGLEKGGYPIAAHVLKALTSAAAVLMLLLCGIGLISVLRKAWLRVRLVIPLLLTVMSVSAITLLWETSARYSHMIHFALAILAAIGLVSLRKKPLWPKLVTVPLLKGVSLSFIGITIAWILCWSTLFVGAMMAKSYVFADLRGSSAEIAGTFVPVQALNARTAAWEGMIEVPSGTSLPVDVQVTVPRSGLPLGSNRFTLNAWIPEQKQPNPSPCRLQVYNDGTSSVVSFEDPVLMPRFSAVAVAINGGARTFHFRILPGVEGRQATAPLRLAFGYILPE